MLHPGTSPSSTFGSSPRMDMARSARLFLCSRCRDQVLLCSHCDRGQRYCSRACSSMSRRERRRQAARRYQNSRRGQLMHAARQSRLRQRRRSLRQQAARRDIDKVTHQGCSVAGCDASLLACETPSIYEVREVREVRAATLGCESASDTAPASAGTAPLAAPAAWVCRRCAHPLLPRVRQGWLRTASVRWRSGHDHPT